MSYDVVELGLTELIGIDEAVVQNQFAASAAISLPNNRARNGIIRSIGFYLNGAAVAISPAGELLILDADPAIAAGDANLIAADWLTISGNQVLTNADVVADATATGGVALYHDRYIPFHALDSLYVTFKLTSATAFNDVAGDDEQLQVNMWAELRN